MATMYNPPHPGETLRQDVLPALGLSVTDASVQLGLTRAALSRVLNGRAGISPEMALHLERWLGIDHGGRASVWLDADGDAANERRRASSSGSQIPQPLAGPRRAHREREHASVGAR